MKSAVNSRGSIYSETEGSICLKCPHIAVEYDKPENIMDKILVFEEEISVYVKAIKKSL